MSSKSGIQKQVLSLYRAALRTFNSRPSKEEQAALRAYARAELEANRASIPRSDTLRIEHLLRSGRRRLESVAGASGFALVRPPPKTPPKPTADG